jgi:hypothetical protein
VKVHRNVAIRAIDGTCLQMTRDGCSSKNGRLSSGTVRRFQSGDNLGDRRAAGPLDSNLGGISLR